MNFGNVLYDIINALLKFGTSITEFLSSKIDITKLLKVINVIGINTDALPREISVLGLVGSISGTCLLVFFVIKLIRG